MPNFATETDVREKYGLTDTTLVPSSLVARSIADAHLEILRRLDPQFDTGSPDDALVLGESLLAGAHVLRTVASSDAFRRKRIQIGGQRIDESSRFDDVLAAAGKGEQQAWRMLEAFLLPLAGRSVAETTASQPIFEEI